VARFYASEPKGDLGGNTVDIKGNAQPAICDDPRYCPFVPPPDLHAFFDDIVSSTYAVAPAAKGVTGLPKVDAKKAAIDDVSVWLAEGLDLAKTAVYVSPIEVGDGPYTITPAYQSAAHKLGQQRIALAGARLATVINKALGK
jgi:hypothetical protein